MRSNLLLVLLLTATACRTTRPEPASLASKDETTARKTESGTVLGGPGRAQSQAWLGIPYARAPEGELRWRAPQPLKPTEEARTAIQFGKPCAQYASPLIGINDPDDNELGGTEDCLTLNIWAPAGVKDTAKLPVMFWIHGGGNSIGSAERYDGGNLATKHQVIVVSAQYRLGPLGWFRHRGLRAGQSDPKDLSGNFATLDLIAALGWVQRNITAFGGDAGNVTVFGESAGAFNTLSLLLAPDAKGLFHKAISQSGAATRWTKAQAENWLDDAEPGHKNSSNEVLARVFIADGKAKDRAEAKAKLSAMSDEELGKYLRSRSPSDLLAGYVDRRGFGMLDAPLIISDGTVLPDADWHERLQTADGWNRVPVMLGTNRDEMKLFLFLDPKRVTRRFWLLPRYVDEPSYHAIAAALSNAWKIAGTDAPAAAIKRGGHSEVYAYRFDWDEEPEKLGADLSGMIGAAHGLEIPFVFGHFEMGALNVVFTEENREGREQLSDAMMSYWANFAHTGAPSRGRKGEAPEWSPWNDGQFVVLDTQKGGGIRMSTETQSWDKISSFVKSSAAIPDKRDKCLLLYATATWDHGHSKARYEELGRELCGDFPFEKHPWGEAP